jgi:tetratricopeptide (TPR) repeat protein
MPQNRSDRRKKLSREEERDLDVRISFFEGLLRRAPDYVDALRVLGDDYTQRGLIQQGLQIDERLARLDPRNPLVFYNLACSYSLVCEFDQAVQALETALALGYRDFKWLARDPDLRSLRQHPLYRPIRDKIRQMKVKIS